MFLRLSSNARNLPETKAPTPFIPTRTRDATRLPRRLSTCHIQRRESFGTGRCDMKVVAQYGRVRIITPCRTRRDSPSKQRGGCAGAGAGPARLWRPP